MESPNHKEQNETMKIPNSLCRSVKAPTLRCNLQVSTLFSKTDGAKGFREKKKQKKEKGLEMSCKRRLSCFFSRRQDREKGNTCLLFPFAFNSEKGYHSMKSNSSKFETEGREHFITARRAGRWTLALQSLRATAACALKKKKGWVFVRNITSTSTAAAERTAGKNVLQVLLLHGFGR